MKNKIISIISRLDNGSHSSNQLQGIDEALTKLFEEEINKYRDALIWCSGSEDFNIGGKARIGWIKICEPLLRNKNHDITHRIHEGICLNIDCNVRPMTEVELQYFELIMAVARKFPNETRHQTALRYIREAEEHATSEGAKDASDARL